jgi:uncharacterized membrane protein YidH (DUF202 family)
MTPLAQATLILFVIIWFLAVGTWFYGTWYWLKFMNARRSGEPYLPVRSVALKAYAMVAGLILLRFIVGAIGNFLGGGWK